MGDGRSGTECGFAAAAACHGGGEQLRCLPGNHIADVLRGLNAYGFLGASRGAQTASDAAFSREKQGEGIVRLAGVQRALRTYVGACDTKGAMRVDLRPEDLSLRNCRYAAAIDFADGGHKVRLTLGAETLSTCRR